ncbi:unnamed protein product [Prorocentrum cordatum]|uniref:Uncharacterized protein n=1 Tax=Prorocentrum cordatum TaxID=2364126 RepID=A0ABN9VTW8_9DINO|nr:unnamed protein product [Polarella glacialis]
MRSSVAAEAARALAFEEREPMCAGGGGAPEIGRIKSNPGLRLARQRPWTLAAGGAVAVVLVVLAVISAVKAGGAPESSPHRRAEVVMGHPPEHVRTQHPTPAPGVKHGVNIGNVVGPLVVPPVEPVPGKAGGASDAGPAQGPARLVVGHPPEHTRTVPQPAAAPAPPDADVAAESGGAEQ